MSSVFNVLICTTALRGRGTTLIRNEETEAWEVESPVQSPRQLTMEMGWEPLSYLCPTPAR